MFIVSGFQGVMKVTSLYRWVAALRFAEQLSATMRQKNEEEKETRRKYWPGSSLYAAKHVFCTAWTAVVCLSGDVRRDGGDPGEGSRAAPLGRRPATEPRLPRLLLGLGQTGSGGSAEGGGGADPLPEDQRQGEAHCHREAACPAGLNSGEETWM